MYIATTKGVAGDAETLFIFTLDKSSAKLKQFYK